MARTVREAEASPSETTNRLLRVMIAILLRQSNNGVGMSLKDQVSLLDELGMRPTEIAQTLGRTSTHINKELAGIRKGKRKGK